jgi:hypothetical protein
MAKKNSVKPQDVNIGSGNINPRWKPIEALLIYWTLDQTSGKSSVDTTKSGCYTFSANGTYTDIYQLAKAVDSGISIPVTALPINPDQYPQPWDFAIDESCYIIFALNQVAGLSWHYQTGNVAVTFKQDQSGWYSDLFHVTPAGPSAVAGNTTKVCYFSAYVDPNEDLGSDQFTIYYQYWFGANLIITDFDPAVKNKGHNHFMGLSRTGSPNPTMPTPRPLPEYSNTPSTLTKKLLGIA